MNIIYSDAYRLYKNKTIRNTIFAAAIIIIFMGLLEFLAANNIWGLGSEDIYFGVVSFVQGNQLPDNNAAFAQLILGSGFLPVILLIFIIAIMGTDYSQGTLQNTLSFETNRQVVYISRFLLGVILSFLLTVFCILFSLIVGLVLFGFGGFNVIYLEHIIYSLLLLLPLYMGLIGFGNFVVVITRKLSSTIIIYLLSMLLLASVAQSISESFPAIEWLAFFDPITSTKTISSYWQQSIGYVVSMIIAWIIVAAITTIIGIIRYKSEDIKAI